MKEKRSQIRIGHPAYSGANRAVLCLSKSQAVRELRMRGFLRSDARDAVNEVCRKVGGYKCVEVGSDVIEVRHWAGTAEGRIFNIGTGVDKFIGD